MTQAMVIRAMPAKPKRKPRPSAVLISEDREVKRMPSEIAVSIASGGRRGTGTFQRERQTTVVRQKANGRTVVTQRSVVRQPQYRSFRKGQRFDQRYARNYRQIDYRSYRGRGLYAPPRGYQWVQSGNDAVLVALASGLIGAVIGGAIR